MAACRPLARALVVRACAVRDGVARRGAQIGGLGAPCKAGGHWYLLQHDVRCRRAPQLRAIVGRAALRLATGRGHLPFANRAGCKRAEPDIVLDTDAHGSCEHCRPGRLNGASLWRSQRNSLSQLLVPGRCGASPRRGRVAGPDGSGGKAREIYALVARRKLPCGSHGPRLRPSNKPDLT